MNPQSMQKILVIIPAFNEGATIIPIIQKIRKMYPNDIIVINDGSTDDTTEILQSIRTKFISHSFNLGYGSSLQTGYLYALRYGYEYVVQLDADGQHRPEYIGSLVNELISNSADLVIGSRYKDKEYGPKYSLIRYLGTKLFNLLIRILTGVSITDSTSGFQGMNRQVVEFYINDFFPHDYPDADVLISTIKKGFRIKEVPVEMEPRADKKRSMHSGWKPFYYIFKLLFSMLVTVLRRPPQGSSTK